MDIESTLILTPEDFSEEKLIYRNLYIQSNKKSLILGKIIDFDSCPMEGAAIVVYKQLITSGIVHRQFIGFTETDKSGNFAILVEKEDYVNYILEVYSPLSSDTFCQ